MKLWYDDNFNELDYSIEMNESTGSKNYIIKGVFSTPDAKNRNGRIYSRQLWETNVQSYQNEIRNNTDNTLMEAEHPPRSSVDKWKAVAKIRKLEMKPDGKVYGEAVILNNNFPESNQIKALIEAGVPIGVSSRGVGRLGKGGIVEDFKLITYDIVSSPSDYNALTQGFNESMILEDKDFKITEDGRVICDESGCRLEESSLNLDKIFKGKARHNYSKEELQSDIKVLKKAISSLGKNSPLRQAMEVELQRLQTFLGMNESFTNCPSKAQELLEALKSFTKKETTKKKIWEGKTQKEIDILYELGLIEASDYAKLKKEEPSEEQKEKEKEEFRKEQDKKDDGEEGADEEPKDEEHKDEEPKGDEDKEKSKKEKE